MAYSNDAKVELTRESAELEARLEPVTAEMNEKPLRVNLQTWQHNLEEAETEADLSIDFCRQMAHDGSFRPNSSADCARVLYPNGTKPLRVSKATRRPLTDKDTLAELAHEGISLAAGIIDARSDISRRGQLRAWKPFAQLGFVQSTWNSMGCPHGRYTSEGPSLTNRIVPIRETIEPDEGFSFLSLDLSQAELVTWASLSGDLTLGEDFLEGRDFHLETAKAIKELVPGWDLRGQELRDAGKTINFALLYQMTEFTLARKLGCPPEIAAQIFKAYFQRAKTATRYIQRVLSVAKETGFVQTFYGRRRYCPPDFQNGISEREAHEVEKTLWSHVNAGSAAEYLKWKTVWIYEALRAAHVPASSARLSLNVFDEAIWQVRDDLLDEVRAIIEPIWFRKEKGFLPFRAEVKIGKSWGGLKNETTRSATD